MQYYQQHAEFKYLNSDRQNFNIELPFHSNCFPFKCLFLLKNIVCGYPLEPPRRGGSNEYQNLCFEQEYKKYQNFSLKIFSFWW